VFQVRANPETNEAYGPEPPEPSGEESNDDKVKGHWNKRLSGFQKLIFVKAFQEEKVC